MSQKNSVFLAAAILSAALLFSAGPAMAQCISGIPCLSPKTPNDPNNPADGPNIVGPNRTKSDHPACDADFMNQIYAKSFVEAQRENIINQVLVRKPDSILEYTCFDMLAGQVAAHAGPVFSESFEWFNVPVETGTTIDYVPYPFVILNVFMGGAYLDSSIQNLVTSALYTYVQGNFSHSFLGGVLGAGGLNSSISGAVNTGGYSCQFMNNVYTLAKCSNANTDTTFESLAWYAVNDPRQLPPGSACSAGTGVSLALLEVAENRNKIYAGMDLADTTYLDRLRGGACGTPVPTGITTVKAEKIVDRPIGNVTLGLTTIYENKICTNPGCYYDSTSNTCRR